MLRHPNAQTVGLVYHFDFRPEKNAFLPYIEAIPLSPFWESLASRPGSLRIAAAPFYFESYNWDASRWERLSGQTVLPGFLTGLCVEQRWGEVPQRPEFRFRNAVHLADEGLLAQRKIDFIVWQRPYVHAGKGEPEAIGNDTAHCEAVLRAKFASPTFEDSHIVVFPVSRSSPSPHAAR